jgi:uncharacterized membrane protein
LGRTPVPCWETNIDLGVVVGEVVVGEDVGALVGETVVTGE